MFIRGVVKKPFPLKIDERENNQFNIITFIFGYSFSGGICHTLALQVTPLDQAYFARLIERIMRLNYH